MTTYLKDKPYRDRRRQRLIAAGSVRLSDYNPSRTAVVYFGEPCLHGHSGERYANGNCVTCQRERAASNSARYRKDPAYVARQLIHKQNSVQRKKAS